MALMKETESKSEAEVLEAVMNLKYDVQSSIKTVKCMKNIQKLLIDSSNSQKFSYKNPPKPKDVWRWVRHICEEYIRLKKANKAVLVNVSA